MQKVLKVLRESLALIPSAQRLVWAAKQPLGNAALVQPAAHWLWQQSLGDLPRQRPEHCWAQMILVTERKQRPL